MERFKSNMYFGITVVFLHPYLVHRTFVIMFIGRNDWNLQYWNCYLLIQTMNASISYRLENFLLFYSTIVAFQAGRNMFWNQHPVLTSCHDNRNLPATNKIPFYYNYRKAGHYTRQRPLDISFNQLCYIQTLGRDFFDNFLLKCFRLWLQTVYQPTLNLFGFSFSIDHV